MPSWPAAVLFDFDGVIVNSEPLHSQATRTVLRERGIELSDADYFAHLVGYNDATSMARAFVLAGRPADPDDCQQLAATKSALLTKLITQAELRSLPGVRELVEHLHGRIPIGICSAGLRRDIELMLAGIGLAEFFDVLVALEDMPVSKPDPSGYRLAMRRLAEQAGRNLAEGDCLVIEDSPPVIASARAAGFRVLAVANSRPAAELAAADWCVPSLQDGDLRPVLPVLWDC